MPKTEIPASPDTERALLGGILLYNAAWPQLKTVTSEDFTLDSHRRIFRCMANLFGNHSVVDLVTLVEELLKHDELEQSGGASYISSLTDGLPKLESLKDYVKIIREKTRRRKAMEKGERLVQSALDPSIEIRAVIDESKAASNGHPTESKFRLEGDGVYATIRTKELAEFDIKVCSPLSVTATTRNENNEEWGRLLEWTDLDKRNHTWAMPMSMLAGSGEDFRRVLLGGGLEIAPTQLARMKLTEYVQTARPEKRAVSVTKLGWIGKVFVFPDETIGDTEETYYFQAPQEETYNVKVHGLIEEWRENIGKLCCGNSRLILAVSCAFAAPLLGLTESESGGFHFWGITSKGKSTTLAVAGSVWGGGGERGYLESWRMTSNGMEILAALHNDGLACLDEVKEADARDIGESVYMLANGQGKGRMTKNVGSRKRFTWRLLFLSSGELTLLQHIEAAGKTAHAGLEVRLISITADAGERMGMFENIHGSRDSKEFAERLTSAAFKFYGAPIRDFLRQIVTNQFRIANRLRERMETFARDAIPSTAPSEIRRAGRRFGLCVAAGELATEWGLTGWSMNEIAPLIKKCLEDWMNTREPGDIDRGVRAVRQFIEQHGASRFQDIKADENARILNRAGYKRTWEGDDATEFLFSPEVFRAEVCRGFNPSDVLEALKAKRFLLTGDDERPSTVVRVPGVGSTRVYRISSSILE